MTHKYGYFSQNQIKHAKENIRKSIFFLLLYVDPKTKQEYCNIDVNQAFLSLLYKLNGLNEVLLYPTELVFIISLIQSALNEYNSPNFNFKVYRKLILDAGAEVLNIKEVDNCD